MYNRTAPSKLKRIFWSKESIKEYYHALSTLTESARKYIFSVITIIEICEARRGEIRT